MIVRHKVYFLALIILGLACPAWAGPYAPAAGEAGSTAVHKDDPDIAAWAAGVAEIVYGEEVEEQWRTPGKALGPAVGDSFDIVCLGRGGSITLTFAHPIWNRAGWDFVVFENGFSDTFLELAYVEVSSDGGNFVRFDNDSLTALPVPGFGALDPTDITGFAGKYRQGYGTPFDLHDLVTKDEVLNGLVDLNAITHVRLVDIVGDGTDTDTSGDVIYDPYPTVLSAGFDLDAVGARYVWDPAANTPPDQAELITPAEAEPTGLQPEFTTGPFSDPDPGDFHTWTRRQAALDPAFTQIVLDLRTSFFLTSWTPQAGLLKPNTTYYWRAKYFDAHAQADGGNDGDYPWSDHRSFLTGPDPDDANGNGVPDDQEIVDPMVDLDEDGTRDMDQVDPVFKAVMTVGGNGPLAVKADPGVVVEYLRSLDPAAMPVITGQTAPNTFHLDLIGLRLRVPTPGDRITVTVYLSLDAPDGYQWYKFNAVLGWYVYSLAVFSPDRRSVALTLEDGGPGDADGLANGVIVDPGGVGSIVGGGTSGTTPQDGEAGFGGGGGGCFISGAGESGPVGHWNAALAGPAFMIFSILVPCRRWGRK